ncbi:pyruvate:ferredoxin (flavodoxin) oxidoreductase [Chitinivibrio alkaliphilus]|uniref:Pyruvate:feredoxin oxidoreductase n=1 Tax=Chitinivibrio alkaliphilus ACht1 TaxID=1313304 RepID=U7DDA3_9BACT|nr:pyruvate:ferredoxin (flavodoxin) oxidoreductase [Chitinivibrio alkaliphilus]ERP38861.1 pyruvate:feredoxin oxidoreductase [Chitinivibrio alkaliphilus ACht1]
MARNMVPHDGNSATAHVAHATNEVIAIYPITPSSPMGEISDAKSAMHEKNIWDSVPHVSELQSEGGAAGAVHGALSTGALTTTFTASQGLLLMIPNMYKIAGELTPTVFHVSARSLACQALSIFGDHSDVMACRQTGFAMLSSASVQEAQDFALISQAATLESRIPFLHFFEGFRVSHEIQKIEELTYDDMKEMIDDDLVRAHRQRGLSPDHPQIMGTSQNPDVYFTGRETVNAYYEKLPGILQNQMDKFGKLTGRNYRLYEYFGAEDAEKVIVAMGAGNETIHETVEYLNNTGEKVGVLKVRMYRPFSAELFVKEIPATVQKIAVLDRTKEPGSLGEPLYEDVRTAIGEMQEQQQAHFTHWPRVVGGRYGLGSAEFTPAMVKAVFDNLSADAPKNHFTIGINDDVMNTSLPFDPNFNIEGDDVFRGLFYGLGSDGTVGANKNSIKIIAKETENYTQGYFVYDSKKSGSLTTSHLRFGPKKIRAPYLISKANFLACHNFSFLEKYAMLKNLEEGGTFLLTSPYGKDEVWDKLPGKVQEEIVAKKLKFYVIDAVTIAEEIGLGSRINMVMQTAFFKISGIMDEADAVKAIKDAIKKTYGKKGDEIVNMNYQAVDAALSRIEEVNYAEITKQAEDLDTVPGEAPEFVKNVTAKLIRQEGETVKVSEMPADGKWMTGTTKFEKRNVAVHIPVWNCETCIQCNRCSFMCPHAVIRPKVYDAKELSDAPSTFKSCDGKAKYKDMKYTLQVSALDCTGCGLCVESCPMKAKEAIKMTPLTDEMRAKESENWDFFINKLPDVVVDDKDMSNFKGTQFVTPLFEFSGACAGCGETQYVKLISQLFGDRAIIANATGCSSIYGGNLPTTPYTTTKDGRGPTWNNSLFEDNAELAFGMRMTVDKFRERAFEVSRKLQEESSSPEISEKIAAVLEAPQATNEERASLRKDIEDLKEMIGNDTSLKKDFQTLADYIVDKSVWAFGGDGWAYDIGYGGLDHVLASGKNVNVLVMDTEVYSNTGGQSSKATPKGAVAKFAASGKPAEKKDLGMIAMSYGNIYVAKVSLSNPNQVVKAMREAEAYDGPSLVLAYSHCIAHGFNLKDGVKHQDAAVKSGHWQLYRYNPELAQEGKNPLSIDSKAPTMDYKEFALSENRFRTLAQSQKDLSDSLLESSAVEVANRYKLLEKLAEKDSQ